MNDSKVLDRLQALEAQVATLQKNTKTEFNSTAVYDTKAVFGYAQAVETKGGQLLFLSGMTPWDQHLQLPATDLLEQLDCTLGNIQALLEDKKLSFNHLVSMRLYIAKPNYYEDLQHMGGVFAKYFGQPQIACTMTMIGVTGLAEPEQLVEVEAIAML